MNDPLQQLLRNADANVSIPSIDATNLPHRIRRTARNQRRLAACGLAILPLAIAGLALLFISRPKQPPSHIAEAIMTNLSLDAALHERVAELVQSAKLRQRPRIDPSDAFFAELKMQRNCAALVLVNDAQHSLNTRDPLAAAAMLRRAIQLFPETPAARIASKQLQQISPSMRQS